ncbi:MAG: hypothetical protein R3C68_13980 [Myxococcota bacterium]
MMIGQMILRSFFRISLTFLSRHARFTCCLMVACTPKVSRATPAVQDAVKKASIAEMIYDGDLQERWMDHGWSKRELVKGKPARIDFSEYGGWIVGNPTMDGRYTGLRFRMKAPAKFGEFLNVRLMAGI